MFLHVPGWVRLDCYWTVFNEFPLIFALGVDRFALLYTLASGGLENHAAQPHVVTLLHVLLQTMLSPPSCLYPCAC